MIDEASIIAEFEDPHRKNKHQHPKEYIITEEDIRILEDSFGVILIMPRSRPHPAPETKQAYRCGYDDGYALAMNEAGEKIRKAREEAQQRIEQAIKELETMKADANARSSRAHRIEDGNWHGSCLCDAPDAELKVITKAIALLQAGEPK